MALGCLSMFTASKSESIEQKKSLPLSRGSVATSSPDPQNAEIMKDMYKSIESHKRSIRSTSAALNLTGIAMVCTAFVHHPHAAQKEVTVGEGNQDPFTLFHAYTLLSLLWLITLVGMMIHVHTWVGP